MTSIAATPASFRMTSHSAAVLVESLRSISSLSAFMFFATAAEWEVILNEAGVAAMEVIPLARAVHHPQLEHRQFFHRFDDPVATGLPPFAVPASPYRLSASPAKIHSMPPRLGQHTDEVLAEYGFSKEEIARLHAEGVVSIKKATTDAAME